MVRRVQDESGDYGYDLVHEGEGTFAGWTPGGATPVEATGGTIGGKLDPGGDYGYDEAHDL